VPHRQIRRAAESVPTNIAEGAGHDSARAFTRFLGMAIASVHQVQHHLLLGRDTQRLREATADALLAQVESVRRMPIKLKRRVQGVG
jgi:four helix bundle protein